MEELRFSIKEEGRDGYGKEVVRKQVVQRKKCLAISLRIKALEEIIEFISCVDAKRTEIHREVVLKTGRARPNPPLGEAYIL